MYTTLLRFLGCTSDASETAVLAGGDEIAWVKSTARDFVIATAQRAEAVGGGREAMEARAA